jgi:hypothetical protein
MVREGERLDIATVRVAFEDGCNNTEVAIINEGLQMSVKQLTN